jgi:hypothetical protein
MDAPALPPKTTAEADRHTAGQRQINRIWELTQALIALMVSCATLFVASSLALSGIGEMAAFLLLSNAFFLVVGFYFGRTNHQRIGGIDIGR